MIFAKKVRKNFYAPFFIINSSRKQRLRGAFHRYRIYLQAR